MRMRRGSLLDLLIRERPVLQACTEARKPALHSQTKLAPQAHTFARNLFVFSPHGSLLTLRWRAGLKCRPGGEIAHATSPQGRVLSVGIKSPIRHDAARDGKAATATPGGRDGNLTPDARLPVQRRARRRMGKDTRAELCRRIAASGERVRVGRASPIGMVSGEPCITRLKQGNAWHHDWPSINSKSMGIVVNTSRRRVKVASFAIGRSESKTAAGSRLPTSPKQVSSWRVSDAGFTPRGLGPVTRLRFVSVGRGLLKTGV